MRLKTNFQIKSTPAAMYKLIILWVILSCSTEPGKKSHCTYDHGGMVRLDSTHQRIYLVFTGHEFADGAEVVLSTLEKHRIQASFFFTGDFYRNPAFAPFIRELETGGHYFGAHSDRHLLYCSWEDRDSLLVSRRQFVDDLQANYAEMKKFGVDKNDAPFFMPPYEWYNDSISAWTAAQGLQLINFTSGTLSHADWTYPELGTQYRSSQVIWDSLVNYEAKHGLNGFILLTHVGTDPRRADKFYNRLDALIQYLSQRGYEFHPLSER